MKKIAVVGVQETVGREILSFWKRMVTVRRMLLP